MSDAVRTKSLLKPALALVLAGLVLLMLSACAGNPPLSTFNALADAKATLIQAEQSNPADPDLARARDQLSLAESRYRKGDFEEAEDLANTATKLAQGVTTALPQKPQSRPGSAAVSPESARLRLALDRSISIPASGRVAAVTNR